MCVCVCVCVCLCVYIYNKMSRSTKRFVFFLDIFIYFVLTYVYVSSLLLLFVCMYDSYFIQLWLTFIYNFFTNGVGGYQVWIELITEI